MAQSFVVRRNPGPDQAESIAAKWKLASAFKCAGAKCLDLAICAVGFSRVTAAPPVPDEPMAEVCPVTPRNHFHKVLFDFDWVGVTGEFQAARQTCDVGIDDDTFVPAKSIPENDVSGLAADPCEGGEGLHGAGNFAIVLRCDVRRRGADVLCFAPEETGCADQILQCFLTHFCKIRSGPAALKERLCDNVDAFVGALGRQNGCHEKLKRIIKFQLAVCFGVNPGQGVHQGFRPLCARHCGWIRRRGFAWSVNPTRRLQSKRFGGRTRSDRGATMDSDRANGALMMAEDEFRERAEGLLLHFPDF